MCEFHRHARGRKRANLLLLLSVSTSPSLSLWLRDVTLSRWYSVINIPFVLSSVPTPFVYIFLFPACTIHPSLLSLPDFSSLILPLILARSLFSPLSLPLSLSLSLYLSFSLTRLLLYVIFLPVDFTLYDPLLHLLAFLSPLSCFLLKLPSFFSSLPFCSMQHVLYNHYLFGVD